MSDVIHLLRKLRDQALDAERFLHPDLFELPTHDNTMLSAYARCPRLYELMYVRNKRPVGAAPALDWGSLFHLGLSVWYTHMVQGGETGDTALKAALEAMMKSDFDNPTDDFRTRERALLMMTEYADYYGWMERRWGWKIVFAETAFDVRGPRFPYGGKIDLLVEWEGKLYVVDHKTTTRFGDTYYDSYVPDTQTCGYAKFGALLHGRPIEGVFMNVIVIHKVKKPSEQQFHRRAFSYPEFFYDEWEEQTYRSLVDIARSRAEGYYRPRWQNCVDKYGKCAGYYLCRSAPENREKILKQQWRDETWDWRKVDEFEQMPKELQAQARREARESGEVNIASLLRELEVPDAPEIS